MNVLVVNAGSSSLKYQLLNTQSGEVFAKGNCERIGIDGSFIGHEEKGAGKSTLEVALPDHRTAIKHVFEILETVDAPVEGIGHRVVQGGWYFPESAVVTDETLAQVREVAPLAPLHNYAEADVIEICRDIANRFNNLHPNTFTIPEGYYPKVGEGAKITSLVDPNSKMSKSDPNPNGYILLMDKPEDIMRKFKRAVTDSDSRIIFDPQNKPGVSNLLQIYALATGKTIEQAAAEFDGKGYGEFKPAVGEAVVELLRPIREKTTDLLNNKDYLEQVYKEGAQKASYLARKTLDKVYRKVGFVAR